MSYIISFLLLSSYVVAQTPNQELLLKEKVELEKRLNILNAEKPGTVDLEIEQVSLRYSEVMVGLEFGVESSQYKELISKNQIASAQLITQPFLGSEKFGSLGNPQQTCQPEAGSVTKEDKDILLEVIGGPSSGVVYLNAPLSFGGPWLNSEYQRGSRGTHAGIRLKGDLGNFEVLHFTMNKKKEDMESGFVPSYSDKHQDVLQIRYLSPELSLGKLKGVDVGVKGKGQLFYSYNKYEQDFQQQGVDEAKAVKDLFLVVSPELSARKDWSFLKNHPRIGLDVKAQAGFSPIGLVQGKSDQGNKPGASGFATQTAPGLTGSFGLATLLKVKNKEGVEKWVVAISYTQNEAHGYGKTLSMSENILDYRVDYHLTDRINVGLQASQTRRMTKMDATQTIYFDVLNTMGVSASIQLGSKKKARLPASP
jgi:hypothetical protein